MQYKFLNLPTKRKIRMYSSIQSSSHIGIFTHMNPDGDALGSSIGLAGYLKQNGFHFTIFLPCEPSESLGFMIPEEMKDNVMAWGAGKSAAIQKAADSCDLMVGVDFNTPDRIGDLSPILTGSKAKKILVDHHVAPATEYFDLVYSRTDVSSACELLYSILKTMPDIDGDASKLCRTSREALMTGMTTDTNNFSNSTYPGTFMMASELIAAGTDRDSIIDKLFFRYPERRIRLQGRVLDKLLKITGDGVAYIILDGRTQKRFGVKEGDTEGFVNIPLSIKEVRMSILLKREPASKRIRVSVRSKKGTSARNLAMKYFHGGGHEQASGGRLMLGEDIKSMSELAAYVENCTREFFKVQ